MLVSAVACVDDRDAGVPAGPQRCALLGVAHGHDVGVAGDDADGVGHALALGCTGDGLAREAEDMSAEVQHRGLKRKTGAGGRLVEQGGQLFVGGHVLISSRVGADAVGQVQQRGDLLLTEIQRIDQMTHIFCFPPSKKLSKNREVEEVRVVAQRTHDGMAEPVVAYLIQQQHGLARGQTHGGPDGLVAAAGLEVGHIGGHLLAALPLQNIEDVTRQVDAGVVPVPKQGAGQVVDGVDDGGGVGEDALLDADDIVAGLDGQITGQLFACADGVDLDAVGVAKK